MQVLPLGFEPRRGLVQRSLQRLLSRFRWLLVGWLVGWLVGRLIDWLSVVLLLLLLFFPMQGMTRRFAIGRGWFVPFPCSLLLQFEGMDVLQLEEVHHCPVPIC